MCSYALGGSVVLSGLFLTLGSLGRTALGERVVGTGEPSPAATRAAADPWMNSRRLRYTLFGVISEERMSGAFLISMSGL